MSKVDADAVSNTLRERLAAFLEWPDSHVIERATSLYAPPAQTDVKVPGFPRPPHLGLTRMATPLPPILISLGQEALGLRLWSNFRARCETDLNPDALAGASTFGRLTELAVEWLSGLESCAAFLVVRKVVARNSGLREDLLTASNDMPEMDDARFQHLVDDLRGELQSSLDVTVVRARLEGALQVAGTLADARDGVIELL